MTTIKSIAKYQKQYRLDNRARLNLNQKILLNTNPVYKESQKCRTAIHYLLTKCNAIGFKPLVGCTAIFLRNFIENQFTGNMSWENYGKLWNIDHRVSLSTASTPDEVRILNHYSNLQPILKMKNSKKYTKSTIMDLMAIIDNCSSLKNELTLV